MHKHAHTKQLKLITQNIGQIQKFVTCCGKKAEWSFWPIQYIKPVIWPDLRLQIMFLRSMDALWFTSQLLNNCSKWAYNIWQHSLHCSALLWVWMLGSHEELLPPALSSQNSGSLSTTEAGLLQTPPQRHHKMRRGLEFESWLYHFIGWATFINVFNLSEPQLTHLRHVVDQFEEMQ